MSQTTLNPCWFCGEPSVSQVELYPAEFEKVKGKLNLKKNAVRGWVCATHKERVDVGRGWQDRQRAKRSAATKAAKADQLSLGDAA